MSQLEDLCLNKYIIKNQKGDWCKGQTKDDDAWGIAICASSFLQITF